MSCEEEVEKLRIDLTCRICSLIYRDPVTLECGHTFCRVCVASLPRDLAGMVTCPLDGLKSNPLKVKDNPLAKKMADLIRKVLDGMALPAGETSCPDGQPFTHFSLDNLQLLCPKDLASYKADRILTVMEAAIRYRDKIKQTIEMLEKQKQDPSATDDEASLIELKKQGDTIRARITSDFSALRDFLNQQEKLVLMEVEKQEDAILTLLEERHNNPGTSTVNTDHLITDLRAKLNLADIPLLRIIGTLFDSSGKLLRSPAEAAIDLSQGLFNVPLQYAMWRRMLKIIYPVPLRLTLDARTANAHLILSDDLAEVRVGDKQLGVPDNPERFSRWLAVLTTQGFTSGRHCWEVEVGESIVWQVGVAKESVNRKKGFAPLSGQESRKFFTPEPQAGVWALALQDGEYTVLTSPTISLTLTKKPKIVGVYLDYQAGYITFYNGDDVSHIYTFKDKFTEKVFPYFYLAHKGDFMRLLSLRV